MALIKKNELYSQISLAHSHFHNHLGHISVNCGSVIPNNPIYIPSSNKGVLPMAFYIITFLDGLYLLEYDEPSSKYNSTQLTDKVEKYSRGEMSSEGIYAVACHSSNNIKLFNMTGNPEEPKQIELIGTFSTAPYQATDCFFTNTNRVICCAYAQLKAIDLDSMTQSIFHRATTHDFTACTQDKNKNIYTGGPGQIEILDPDGNLLKLYRYGKPKGQNQEAREIVEIRSNVFITADIDSYTIHDMTNFGNIISISHAHDGYSYYTVIALQSTEGSFALGGEFAITDDAHNGFVYIMNLADDKQSLCTSKFVDDLHGNLTNINTNDCRVQVIKEIQLGTIIFGVEFCDRFCIWNYVAYHSPQCMTLDFITDYHYGISDISPIYN